MVIVFRGYLTYGYEVIFFLHRELCLRWYKKAKRKNKVVGALLHPSIKYMYVYVCKVVGASVSSHLSSLVFNRSSVSSKHRGAIIQ